MLFAVFNVGEYRRRATLQYRNHDFFRADNMEAMEIREWVISFSLSRFPPPILPFSFPPGPAPLPLSSFHLFLSLAIDCLVY